MHWELGKKGGLCRYTLSDTFHRAKIFFCERCWITTQKKMNANNQYRMDKRWTVLRLPSVGGTVCRKMRCRLLDKSCQIVSQLAVLQSFPFPFNFQAVESLSLTLFLEDWNIHLCVSFPWEESRIQKSSAGLCFTAFQDIHSAVVLGQLWGKIYLGKITYSCFLSFPSQIKKNNLIFLMKCFFHRVIQKEMYFSQSLPLWFFFTYTDFTWGLTIKYEVTENLSPA